MLSFSNIKLACRSKMSKSKKHHADWMTSICGVCIRKGSEVRPISDIDLERIRKHHYPNYDLSVMPTVACKSCKKALSFIDEHGKNAGLNLPEAAYENLRLPSSTATRQQAICCDCSFCQVGRMNGIEYQRYCAGKRAGQGRPPAEDKSAPLTATGQKICSLCKGKYLFYFSQPNPIKLEQA